MIEVHLYGCLRKHGPTNDVTVPCVVLIEGDDQQKTVRDLVVRLGIRPQEVANVFRDGRWARDGLDAPLAGVGRIGLFPRNMSLLYV